MMITFVSQCQKNALKKTRRVLDAFADRIGDNTWQTVITEDGLAVVKKMLRQTASKNTAIACHWIRSRSRSEYLWAVGNKNQFNEEGRVPVNYTENELILDETKMMTEKVYANTKMQPLDQHLFAVGYLAHCLIKQLLDDEKISIAAFIAGGLHDIGKLDPEFQDWLSKIINKHTIVELPEDGLHIDKGKFSFETHARHNEISLLLYHLLNDESFKDVNSRNKNLIKHVVYWHHAKPIRKDDFTSLDTISKKLDKSLGNTKREDFYAALLRLIASVNKISKEYGADTALQLTGFLKNLDDDKLEDLKNIKLPLYKSYSSNETINNHVINVDENARLSIARSAVISADRLVSALSKDQLASHIEQRTLTKVIDHISSKEGEISKHIQQSMQWFESTYPGSSRNSKQSEAAKKLADIQGVAVLNGPAGCGKTKIALEWSLNSGVKKIIWVCPRVQVCEGLYQDLTSTEYLPNAKIEICTGELKKSKQSDTETPTLEGKEFSGDIVLTTIDQVINTLITHRNVTSLIDFMTTHVVFDEYHEYVNMPAFNLLFAELVRCKQLQKKNAKALLVSATPNYVYLKQLLDIEREDIVGIESFNQSKYKIGFQAFDETKNDSDNPLFALQPKNSIVITNTATTAQLSFIASLNTENAVLYHAKYKQSDKTMLFNQVFECFKQAGNRNYDVLRSGPIVQASLNITCEHMVTEFTNAENWLQRLGRLDRFGENESVNNYVVALPQKLADGKRNGACARFLSSLHSLHSALAWHDFLKNNLPEQPITITQLYQLYENFYASGAGQQAIESDLLASLKNSVQIIERKVHDPISFPKKKVMNENRKLKKSSLRGDNRFVEMAVCEVLEDGSFEFRNQYACGDKNDSFTMSVDLIQGHDEGGDKNLISFMHQKHHKILSAKNQKKHPQAHKSFLLKNEAIDPDHPVYLSYTQEDLDLCNDKPHPCAIYYAVSDKQPIGAISINELNKPSINEE
jgi:CRISPR-associated endonuclease/helicase Cas3